MNWEVGLEIRYCKQNIHHTQSLLARVYKNHGEFMLRKGFQQNKQKTNH